jgi:UDP-N-acetylmuramate dehydrogenase
MDEWQQNRLAEVVLGDIQFDCPMGQYTTLRAGGRAEAVCFPCRLEMLQQIVSFLGMEKIPYMAVGRGSNLLIRESGFKGVIIILKGELATIEREGMNLFSGAGLSIPELISYCSANGLTGLEFLAGIPGSVGGAAAMNAGAFDKDAGSMISHLFLITGTGEQLRLDQSELKFQYRSMSVPEGAVIFKVCFELDEITPEAVRARVTGYLKKRRQTHPLEYPNAGSVFKNPLNDFAGRLIEEAGLKGERVGGAMISQRHGNFIVNAGGASANDILELMELAADRVEALTGIRLEPEIKIV